MKINEWIAHYPGLPTTIRMDSALKEILAIMLEPPFPRDVYVVSDANRLVGHLSLKKIAHQLLPQYQAIHTRRQMMHRITGSTVKELMNAECSYARDSEELEDVFHLLMERDIEELPVIDEQGVLVGIIHLFSVLRYLLATQEDDTICRI